MPKTPGSSLRWIKTIGADAARGQTLAAYCRDDRSGLTTGPPIIRRSQEVFRSDHGRRSPLGGRPSGGFDLATGRTAELIGRHVLGHVDLTIAQYLHRLAGAHRAAFDEPVDVNTSALGVQSADSLDIDDLVFLTERVPETLEFRQPHVDRHLAALEAGRYLIGGPCTFGSPSRGLAFLGCSQTNSHSCGFGAGRGTQMMHFHSHII